MNSTLKDGLIWILAFLGLDLFFIFLIILISPELIDNFIIFILLFTILALLFILRTIRNKNKRKKDLLEEFLINNSFLAKDALVNEFGSDYKKIFNDYQKAFKIKDKRLEESRSKLISYRNFIEMWAHEIKTPLAFANLFLENHKNDFDRESLDKLSLANANIENYINQILYYARLDASKKDYKMEDIYLKEAVDEAIKAYYPLIAEEGIIIKEDVGEVEVFTDKNTLVFIISQIISNAIKYCDGVINIRNKGKNLYIGNNGPKVADQDLAFIFEKAFTGEVDKIHKSTGMGLYLARLYGKDLSIDIEVVSNEDRDFEICLKF
ncbi:HAMP domain-containing histidine kinase [Anaerococcus sp. NML200537]|uniref:histidine kinase n=2 Tax=Anaerococcus TaxID=165779 RepID=A0ABW9MDP8_9FIRM|nr:MULTISPECIES: HAMP domain-containing sensor histidine kinase [unclassified Anaerococcus]MCW6702274.1 HAMP domain-containing histidine kinase [Anaerococcus sp. NML200537]